MCACVSGSQRKNLNALFDLPLYKDIYEGVMDPITIIIYWVCYVCLFVFDETTVYA